MIDPDVADIQWEKNTNKKQSERANAQKRNEQKAPSDQEQAGEYWKTRTRRENAEATIAELKAAEMAGSLVSIERVKAASMRMSRMLRDALLAIPAKISPQLAIETEVHTIDRMLGDALRRVLDDIAGMTANDIEDIDK